MSMTPPNTDASVDAKLDYIAQHLAAHLLDQTSMQTSMQAAVAEGIKAAVGDPAFWSAAGAAMQQRAVSTTGNWVIGAIKAAFSRLGIVVMVLIGMGMVGGWPGFVAAVKAVTASGHAP